MNKLQSEHVDTFARHAIEYSDSFILTNISSLVLKELKFFTHIIYFTHFGADINCLNKFEPVELKMGVCAPIAHNGSDRDQKWTILRSDYTYI